MKKDIFRVLASLTIVSQFMFVSAPLISAEEITPDESVVVESQTNDTVVTSDVITDVTTDVTTDATPDAVTEVATPTEETASAETAPVIFPELTTDKADYLVGEIATIFGRFFQSLQNIILKIFGGNVEEGTYTEEIQNVTADDQGSFTTTYTLDNVYRPLYTVTANNSLGELLAQTTFADPQPSPQTCSQKGGTCCTGDDTCTPNNKKINNASDCNECCDIAGGGTCQAPTPSVNPSVSIDQCANGGIGATPERCATKPPLSNATYQTGNVNGQKAHWQEGEVLPYRAVLKDLAAGVNTVTFSFDTAKGSELKHAIDYLASFDYTETTGAASGNHANLNNPCGDTIAGCNPSAPDATADITVLTYFTTSYPSSCANGTFGGTPLTGQQIKAWGPVSAMSLSYPDGAIPTSGDCSPRFKITFTVATDHSDVVIAWGGHIAANNDPGIGGYWGAGNAVPTGSPYHMHAGFPQESPVGTFYQVGNQDLQLASSAIAAPSTITIIKDTVPDGPQDFAYTTTGDLTPVTFSLDDDADGTLNNTQIFSSGVIPGTYTVTEGDPTSFGYALTSLNCNVTGTGSSATPNPGGRSVSITIGSTGGANVTCTFVNTLQTGTIELKKVWSGTGGQTTLNIGTTAGGTDVASTQTGANGTTPLTTGAQTVNAGTYYVSETGGLANYDSVLACTDNGSPVTPGTNNSLSVAATHAVVCTYTNTRQTGTIIVKKVMVGGTDTFSYTGTPNGSISTNNGTIQATVDTGQYTSTEGTKSGWDLTDITCNDANSTQNVGSRVATFNVEKDETVTCTFTNTKRGHIIVDKVTVGGDTTFSFDASGGTDPAYVDFTLTGVQTPNDQTLKPGGYSVTETVPDGWDLSSVSCVSSIQDTEVDTALELDAGETITCTFNDTKIPTLTVNKILVPSSDSGKFNLQIDSVTAGTGANVGDGGTTGAVEVSIGGHIVGETAGTATTLSDYTTVIGGNCDAQGNVTLAAGDNKTCTITNTKKGNIVIEKQTLPDASSQSFTFTGEINTSLTDGNTSQKQVVPGTYTVTESALAGWDLTSLVCDDANSTGDTGTRTATFRVEAGETVKCTFTNTQRGHIIIQKDAIPDSSQEFIFNNNFGNGNPATFGLVDDSTPGYASRNSEVLPGKYAVSENAVAGWESPESATCDSGETIGDIDVGPGETVTCLFMNEKLATIILVKNTIGGNGPFDFVMTGTGLPVSDQLTTIGGTAQETYNDLDPDNTYTIAETPIPAGWAKTGASCDNGDPVTAIMPNAGETITCTFTNNKPAAQIDLAPLDGVNKVGQNHIITATVQVQNGDGNWGPATDGTVVTFSITNSNGATAVFVPASPNTCTTSGGSCTITINSPTAGHVVVHASASPIVLGVTLPVSTGSGGDNSADAQKTYVNAKISITPATFTNEVDDPHDFTVKVEADNGDGTGLQPVNGAIANAIATPAPDGGLNVADCNDGTNASGECTVTINSSIAGVFTIIARSTISVGGVEFKLQTNGVSPNSGPATKTYVDGKINLTPLTGTNNINVAHTITATVMENPGTGEVAAEGALVTFSLSSNTAGAAFVGGNTCTTNSSGQCSVQINTATPGSVDIDATVDVHVGGLTLTRATDATHGSSDNANKVYVAGKIIVEKQTLPDGSSQSFEFDPSWSATNFNLTDGQQNNSGWLSPGNYSVVEIVPTSWDFTSAFCSIEGQIGTFPYTPGENISLGAGNIITCIFTNTQRGHIIIDKVTVPSLDPQSFTFVTSGTGYSGFSLTDAAAPNDQELVPGTYSVAETVPAGWDLTGAVCARPGIPSAYIYTPGSDIVLAAGETVTCTFTNTKKGKITIVKDAEPNDCQDFTFTKSWNGTFVLDDNSGVVECTDTDRPQSIEFVLSANNSYGVTETIPNDYWKLKSITCVGASDYTTTTSGVTINLKPGEDITCTFLNEKQSPTRTQGFWKTHTSFTSDIFTANFLLPSGMTLGLTSGHYVTIDSTAKLFGAWYSDVNFETTIVNKKQVKRDPIEKARILLAHQLITAKLNCAAFGGCPTSINSMIASADAAYAGTNIGAMNTAMSALDAFNNSGDTIIISPPLPWQGKATPKDSQSLAQSGIPSGIAFWDQP